MVECPECEKNFEGDTPMKIHYGLTHEGTLSRKIIICDRCGEEAERRKTVIEDNEETFCSRECKYDTKKTTECSNDECSTRFEAYKYRLKKGECKYCSLECRNDSYRNGKTFECMVCGDEFYRSKSEVEQYPNKFCSHECQTDKLAGENHYAYKEDKRDYTYTGRWSSAREERLEEDNYECQECGREDKLHIHHITPYNTFDDKIEANRQSNLITLCSTCHLKHEKGGADLDCLPSS